jgi:hypothetical protein
VRVYSTAISWESIAKALRDTGLENDGIVVRAFQNVERENPKKARWPNAFDFTLRAKKGRDRFSKQRNHPSALSRTVPSEPEYPKTPTYFEWGILLSNLYSIDPNARIGPYKNSDHFHQLTNNQF